jgi:hypothetical protein
MGIIRDEPVLFALPIDTEIACKFCRIVSGTGNCDKEKAQQISHGTLPLLLKFKKITESAASTIK